MKRILFIDDEPDILEAVKIILEDEGFDVKTQPDIGSVEEIEDFNPNLIILDMLLTGGSAASVGTKIRESKVLSNTPLIVLSANPVSKLKSFAMDFNAVSYLQKPFDLDVLVAVVKKFSS